MGEKELVLPSYKFSIRYLGKFDIPLNEDIETVLSWQPKQIEQ